jgi:hypothetical protein
MGVYQLLCRTSRFKSDYRYNLNEAIQKLEAKESQSQINR